MLTKESALAHAVDLLKQGYPTSKVYKNLTKEGFSELDINNIINEAIEIKYHKADKIRRAVFIVLSIIAISICLFALPLELVLDSQIIFSVLMSTICSFFLVQAVLNFRSIEELNPPKKPSIAFLTPKEDWRLSALAIIAVFFTWFILCFVFGMYYTSKEQAELKEYGIVVKGTVVDGKGTRSRRSASYEISVNFQTLEDKSITVTKDVSQNDFNSLHQDAEIELIYSSRNPKIVNLYTESTILKNIDTEDREILLPDLIKLISIDTHEDASAFLNKISYGWEFDTIQGVWMNERKAIVIKYVPQVVLMSSTSSGLYFSLVYSNLDNVLTDLNFKKIESGEKRTTSYESDDCIISFQNKTDGNGIQIVTTITKK